MSVDKRPPIRRRSKTRSASQAASAAEEVPTVEAPSEFTVDEPAAEFTVDDISAATDEAPALVPTTSVQPPVPAMESHVPAALHSEPAASTHPVSEVPVTSAPEVLQ